MNEDIKGLRERIAEAGTPEEISRLLDEGSTYANASDRTRSSWRNTAAKRLLRLKAEKAVVAPAVGNKLITQLKGGRSEKN